MERVGISLAPLETLAYVSGTVFDGLTSLFRNISQPKIWSFRGRSNVPPWLQWPCGGHLWVLQRSTHHSHWCILQRLSKLRETIIDIMIATGLRIDLKMTSIDTGVAASCEIMPNDCKDHGHKAGS